MPSIAVVMPAYNAARWIDETLELGRSPRRVRPTRSSSSTTAPPMTRPRALGRTACGSLEQANGGPPAAYNAGFDAAALGLRGDVSRRRPLGSQQAAVAGTGAHRRSGHRRPLRQGALLRPERGRPSASRTAGATGERPVPARDVRRRPDPRADCGRARRASRELGRFDESLPSEDYEFWLRALCAGATFAYDERVLVSAAPARRQRLVACAGDLGDEPPDPHAIRGRCRRPGPHGRVAGPATCARSRAAASGQAAPSRPATPIARRCATVRRPRRRSACGLLSVPGAARGARRAQRSSQGARVRILWVATAHEYGDPQLGPSLRGDELPQRARGDGPRGRRLRLPRPGARERARRDERASSGAAGGRSRPDLAFFFLLRGARSRRGRSSGIGALGIPTLNWFADDHWRFDGFSRHYARVLTWSVTTDPDAVAKYAADGLGERVLLSQWACNRYAYDRVGARSRATTRRSSASRTATAARWWRRSSAAGHRRARASATAGERGRVGHEEMVRHLLHERRSTSTSPTPRPRTPACACAWGALRRAAAGRTPRPRPSQIKGRTFEVPGSGGFLLTDRVAHLERYFDIGREIAVFTSTRGAGRAGTALARPSRRARGGCRGGLPQGASRAHVRPPVC